LRQQCLDERHRLHLFFAAFHRAELRSLRRGLWWIELFAKRHHLS
jgi:hypothetical protein